MKLRKKRYPKPPKDIFVSGSATSIGCALVAFIAVYGSSAAGYGARNERIAQLFEACAPGTSQSDLVDYVGTPSSEILLGDYRLLKFAAPKDFNFEIDVMMRGDKVFRVFALETDGHRTALEEQIAGMRKK